MIELIKEQLSEAKVVLDKILADEQIQQNIHLAAQLFVNSIQRDGKIFSCGNGGSNCDAMHFAEELTGKFREERKALPAIAISDSSHISCTANDYGFEHIFSRYVEALGNERDSILAISTSGNSPNIIEAAKVAKAKGMKIVALTGKTGGALAELADVEIRVAHQGYSDRIQEIHIKVIHIIILLIEKSLFD